MIKKIIFIFILSQFWVISAIAATGDELLQAETLLRAGDPDAAQERISELLRNTPDDVAARFLQARIHTVRGETDNAIAGYEALIKEHPELPEAYNNLAALYVRRGDLAQARLVLEQGLQTNPAYATLYRNIGAVYREMARKSYTEARLLKGEMKPLELQQLPELVASPHERSIRR